MLLYGTCSPDLSTLFVYRFIQAAADNVVSILDILHSAGINVNCADYDGRTALHLAVSNGSMDATKRLLQMEDINVRFLLHNNQH